MINDQVVPDWLYYQAQYFPHRLALVYGDRTWDFAALELAVQQTLATLTEIKPLARIALLGKNGVELLLLILAIARRGGTVVLLNTRLSAIELTAQISESGASWLFYDPELAAVAQQINLIDCQVRSYPLKLSCPQALDQVPKLDLNHCQGIMFSSGTSGQPKAIPLTFGQHYHSALAVGMRLGFQPRDRLLICLPLFHVGGLAQVWRSLIWGMTMILLPSFQPALLQGAIAQASHISLVPTMLEKILADPEFDPAPWQQLTCILLGGAATQPHLVDTCLALNLPIALSYGMTEAASTVSLMTPAELAAQFHLSSNINSSTSSTVGRPLICNQVKILAAPGEPGEIYLRGTNITGTGWYATGDLGYFDQQQQLHVLQRRTDLIISGGENIYPREIELTLLTHEAIAAVCVLAQPDPIWGQKVVAAIVSTVPLTLKQVQEHCLRRGLARFKLPKMVKRLPELPQTAQGKIDRQALQQLITDHK